MARWYEALPPFLAAQPAATMRVTLTLAELEAAIGVPVPAAAATRHYWLRNGSLIY